MSGGVGVRSGVPDPTRAAGLFECRRSRRPFLPPPVLRGRKNAWLPHPPGIRRIAFLLAWFSIAIPFASAAAPDIDCVFPAGGRQGSTFDMEAAPKAAGKISPWPANAWSDAGGITFEPETVNGTFKVTIAKDAPVGPHLIRIFNADGTSAPHGFVVGRHMEVLEREPNDDARKAQPIDTLPAIVNGRLEKKGDVDSFSVQADADRWIVAELQCHRLGAPIDPALHLLDPDGNEIAFNHDTFGLDPLIACRAARTGRYVVQVVGFDYPPSTEVRFAGSKAAVYRLLLTTGPYARYAFPAGVRRGEKPTIQIGGWNLGGAGSRRSLEFDSSGVLSRAPFKLLSVPDIDNALPIELGDFPEQQFDAGPPAPDKPRDVTLPVTVNGRIAQAGQTHRYRFPVTKGRQYRFTPAAPLADLPLRPALVLEDAAGKALARAGGTEAGEAAAIDWTAPADETCTLAISDLYHQGGDDHVYRVEMRPVTPDYRAALDSAAVKLEAGKSAQVKVTIARAGGFAAPLEAMLDALPAGVTASTHGATTAGALTITLTAAPDAAGANVPLRVMTVAAEADDPRPRRATFPLGAEQLLSSCDSLWLTVVPRPPTTRPWPATAPASDPRAWRIMPVGDSITEGGKTFSGYRYPLLVKLREAGYRVVYVGSRTSGSPAGPLAHEGYSGKNAEFIATAAAKSFRKQPADIVLIHAGHNHFASEHPVPKIVAATESMIRSFRESNPRVIVLLAQVIPSGKLPKYGYIPELNAALAKLGDRLNAPGQPVIVVNQAAGFDPIKDTIEDHVHPNASGAGKMAERWFDALTHALPGKQRQ